MNKKYPCNFEITTYVPKGYWAETLVKSRFMTVVVKESDEYQLINYLERLYRAGYDELCTLAQDNTYMSILYSPHMGWKIITTDVKR